MIYCNFYQPKQNDYIIDFYDNKFENNLNTIIANVGIEGDNKNFGYVYNNIYNEKQSFTLWFLSLIDNIKVQTPISDLLRSGIIIFCIKNQFVLLNNWENLYYFTFAFFYLFLFRTGGYLE